MVMHQYCLIPVISDIMVSKKRTTGNSNNTTSPSQFLAFLSLPLPFHLHIQIGALTDTSLSSHALPQRKKVRKTQKQKEIGDSHL